MSRAEDAIDGTAEVTPSLESRIDSLKANGTPLPRAARSFFEPRFGHDFSTVRLHTDTGAAETARDINARAFTVGRNIVFGAGQYSPETPGGKQLLAHELTHVVQQNAGLADKHTDARLRRSLFPQANRHAGPVPDVSLWALDKTLPLLCADMDGKTALDILNKEKYQVYSYDSYTYKRQYYEDATKTKKQGAPESHQILGYHSRPKKEIALNASRTDQDAASTFVHEVTHAKQHMKFEAAKAIDPLTKPPTKAEKEYEAHIKQEEFNIRNNIPSKSALFRKKVGDVWVVDVEAIKKWVDTVYAIGPDKFYDDVDEKLDGKKGPLGPWICA